MGLLLFFTFSLLLARVSPLPEAPKSSCHAEFRENHQHHLNSSAIHLPLHHRQSPCSPAPLLRRLSFSDILLQDESRIQALTSRLTTKPTTSSSSRAAAVAALNPESVSIPLTSGAFLGVGNYITKISLGTPPSSYIVVMDTGSSLSWIQCAPCLVSCHYQVGTIFKPSASSTYHPVTCSAAECGSLQSATRNPSGCTRSNLCVYEASYVDGSVSFGFLSRDALSLTGTTILPSFVFGCGQDNEGLFGKTAGLIGLAKNKLSLLSQLAPNLGPSFSYCLPTAGSTTGGLLSFGSYNPTPFSFTPMVTNSLDGTLYFLSLTSITVSGKPLAVATTAYTRTPTIIDSGTVFTRLPSDVYSALSTAVAGALSNYPRAANYAILDTCFKGSLKTVAVPKVALVFQGGAILNLAPKNLLIDVDTTTTCLAFAPSRSIGVIGNRQQQTFTVVYDVAKSKIGFAAGGCL